MIRNKFTAAICSAALCATALFAVASPAEAANKTYKNCTAMNKDYKHGVGKSGAKDKVKGKSKPVKNFKVNTSIYNKNKKSDRDKDGVACEKR